MLLGVSGPVGSGRTEAVSYFEKCGFTRIDVESSGGSVEALVDHVTARWRTPFVLALDADPKLLEACSKRPFFVHLHMDAPPVLRWKRKQSQGLKTPLDGFLQAELDGKTQLARARRSHMCLVNDFNNVNELHSALKALDVLNETRTRPDWDSYFMSLADLAALRANCMKRRVGCVIVRDHRVIATGYNGTPRGLQNCNEGGCARCNSGQSSGAHLGTCLCLHAEENALLEAGRDRVGMNGTLYCNTCPCLTCSIKIAQSGVTEVVYSQAYSMDEDTARVLSAAGVKLRKHVSGVPVGLSE